MISALLINRCYISIVWDNKIKWASALMSKDHGLIIKSTVICKFNRQVPSTTWLYQLWFSMKSQTWQAVPGETWSRWLTATKYYDSSTVTVTNEITELDASGSHTVSSMIRVPHCSLEIWTLNCWWWYTGLHTARNTRAIHGVRCSMSVTFSIHMDTQGWLYNGKLIDLHGLHTMADLQEPWVVWVLWPLHSVWMHKVGFTDRNSHLIYHLCLCTWSTSSCYHIMTDKLE